MTSTGKRLHLYQSMLRVTPGSSFALEQSIILTVSTPLWSLNVFCTCWRALFADSRAVHSYSLYHNSDITPFISQVAGASCCVLVSAFISEDFPTLDAPMNATSGRSGDGASSPLGWHRARWRRKPLCTAMAMRPNVSLRPSSTEPGCGRSRT